MKITCHQYIIRMLLKFLSRNKIAETIFMLNNTKLKSELEVKDLLRETNNLLRSNIIDESGFIELLEQGNPFLDEKIKKVSNDFASCFMIIFIRRILNCYISYKILKKCIMNGQSSIENLKKLIQVKFIY